MCTYSECVYRLHSTFFNRSIGSRMSLNGQQTRYRKFPDIRFGTRLFCAFLNKIKIKFFFVQKQFEPISKIYESSTVNLRKLI